MARIVTQNGKNVSIPSLNGKDNFAAGYRKDRATVKPTVGRLVIRERATDRTLILVTGSDVNGRFLGQYVSKAGKVVKETPPREFNISRWPLFNARKSR